MSEVFQCKTKKQYSGSDTKYPLAMALVAVGFFIVAVVEIIVNNCTSHGHSHGDNLEESTRLLEEGSSVAIYTMIFGLSGKKPLKNQSKTNLAHSIFEGLAIGLQDTSSQLWMLTARDQTTLCGIQSGNKDLIPEFSRCSDSQKFIRAGNGTSCSPVT